MKALLILLVLLTSACGTTPVRSPAATIIEQRRVRKMIRDTLDAQKGVIWHGNASTRPTPRQ